MKKVMKPKKRVAKKSAKKPLTKLVIDRAKWIRGDGGSDSQLVVGGPTSSVVAGKMCCLGFFGCAVGVPRQAMIDKGSPEDASPMMWPSFCVISKGDKDRPLWDDTKWITEAIRINDETSLSDEWRESSLIAHFAAQGIKLSFKGKKEENSF